MSDSPTSSGVPPQLHLSIPPSTTSFKRSFEQFGFDLDDSPEHTNHRSDPPNHSNDGNVNGDSSSGAGSSRRDNDRHKRARSMSSGTSSGASGSGNGRTSLSTSTSTSFHSRVATTTPPRSTLGAPPRLPTPDIDVDMDDIEATPANAAPSFSYGHPVPAQPPVLPPLQLEQEQGHEELTGSEPPRIHIEVPQLSLTITPEHEEDLPSSPPFISLSDPPTLPPITVDADSAPAQNLFDHVPPSPSLHELRQWIDETGSPSPDSDSSISGLARSDVADSGTSRVGPPASSRNQLELRNSGLGDVQWDDLFSVSGSPTLPSLTSASSVIGEAGLLSNPSNTTQDSRRTPSLASLFNQRRATRVEGEDGMDADRDDANSNSPESRDWSLQWSVAQGSSTSPYRNSASVSSSNNAQNGSSADASSSSTGSLEAGSNPNRTDRSLSSAMLRRGTTLGDLHVDSSSDESDNGQEPQSHAPSAFSRTPGVGGSDRPSAFNRFMGGQGSPASSSHRHQYQHRHMRPTAFRSSSSSLIAESASEARQRDLARVELEFRAASQPRTPIAPSARQPLELPVPDPMLDPIFSNPQNDSSSNFGTSQHTPSHSSHINSPLVPDLWDLTSGTSSASSVAATAGSSLAGDRRSSSSLENALLMQVDEREPAASSSHTNPPTINLARLQSVPPSTNSGPPTSARQPRLTASDVMREYTASLITSSRWGGEIPELWNAREETSTRGRQGAQNPSVLSLSPTVPAHWSPPTSTPSTFIPASIPSPNLDLSFAREEVGEDVPHRIPLHHRTEPSATAPRANSYQYAGRDPDRPSAERHPYLEMVQQRAAADDAHLRGFSPRPTFERNAHGADSTATSQRTPPEERQPAPFLGSSDYIHGQRPLSLFTPEPEGTVSPTDEVEYQFQWPGLSRHEHPFEAARSRAIARVAEMQRERGLHVTTPAAAQSQNAPVTRPPAQRTPAFQHVMATPLSARQPPPRDPPPQASASASSLSGALSGMQQQRVPLSRPMGSEERNRTLTAQARSDIASRFTPGPYRNTFRAMEQSQTATVSERLHAFHQVRPPLPPFLPIRAADLPSASTTATAGNASTNASGPNATTTSPSTRPSHMRSMYPDINPSADPPPVTHTPTFEERYAAQRPSTRPAPGSTTTSSTAATMSAEVEIERRPRSMAMAYEDAYQNARRQYMSMLTGGSDARAQAPGQGGSAPAASGTGTSGTAGRPFNEAIESLRDPPGPAAAPNTPADTLGRRRDIRSMSGDMLAYSHAQRLRLLRMGEGRRRGNLGGFAYGDFMRDDEFDQSYEGLLRLTQLVGEARPKKTPSQVLEKLEKAEYKDWANEDSDKRCPICLDDYAPTDPVMKLNNCSHWLHQECLQQWLQGAGTCPVCRKTVHAPGAAPTSGSQRTTHTPASLRTTGGPTPRPRPFITMNRARMRRYGFDATDASDSSNDSEDSNSPTSAAPEPSTSAAGTLSGTRAHPWDQPPRAQHDVLSGLRPDASQPHRSLFDRHATTNTQFNSTASVSASVTQAGPSDPPARPRHPMSGPRRLEVLNFAPMHLMTDRPTANSAAASASGSSTSGVPSRFSARPQYRYHPPTNNNPTVVPNAAGSSTAAAPGPSTTAHGENWDSIFADMDLPIVTSTYGPPSRSSRRGPDADDSNLQNSFGS